MAVTPDGKTLLVGVDKGNQTGANPIDEKHKKDGMVTDYNPAGGRTLPFPYIGTTLSGALSIVPAPDEKALAAHTATVTCEGARVDLDATNTPLAYGAERSNEMDSSDVRPDRRLRAQRDPLACRQGAGRPAAPSGPPGDRVPDAVGQVNNLDDPNPTPGDCPSTEIAGRRC